MNDITILKELQGYSGSTVLLIKDCNSIFVRKINNVARNIEQLSALSTLDINIPKIISISDNQYDMMYIPHIDMITWLLHNPVDQFVQWLIDSVNKLKINSVDKDWEDVYNTKLLSSTLIKYWPKIKFTPTDLINQLPKNLPISNYHGDLTMENCIFGNDGKFYMIDPITTEYSSWVFDLAKLMQDLNSGWFIRNKNVILNSKLLSIKSFLLEEFPQIADKNLFILMLLRILPYTTTINDEEFVLKEINKLWI